MCVCVTSYIVHSESLEHYLQRKAVYGEDEVRNDGDINQSIGQDHSLVAGGESQLEPGDMVIATKTNVDALHRLSRVENDTSTIICEGGT